MKSLISAFIVFTFSTYAMAASEVKGQGRLFLGSTAIKPDNMNTELAVQGLEQMDLLNQFGVEITTPFFKNIDAGFRYAKRLQSSEENPANNSTDFNAELTGDSFLGVARFSLIKSTFFRADVFGGVGISNTNYKIKTATQDGELSKKTTPTYAAGGSVGIGYKQFYFMLELGIEGNTAKSFSSQGNINSSVTEIDMSGSTITLALMFDGVPVTK